jgi:hypothetical protein
MLKQQLNDGNRAMFAGQVQGNVVGTRSGIDTSRSGKQFLNTVEVAMNDGVNEGGKVVMIDEVDGFRVG